LNGCRGLRNLFVAATPEARGALIQEFGSEPVQLPPETLPPGDDGLDIPPALRRKKKPH